MDHKNPPALGRAVLQPLFHTPESAPTIDTPPQSLGIQDSSTEDLDRAGNADLSASGRVRRAVEKTVDKLGRTKSLATKARAQSPNPNSGPLRRFSLHRGKGTHTPSTSLDISDSPSQIRSAISEESPFVTPPSPTTAKPPFDSFPAEGSMRVGTQTLIQALTAIPWTDDVENDDDILNHDPDLVSGVESDDEDKFDNHMASSIHTIYRPLARSRRAENYLPERTTASKLGKMPERDEDRPDTTIMSEDEIEDDFEPQTHNFESQDSAVPSSPVSMINSQRADRRFSGTGSMATVRIKRRAQLADKLREIFELDGIRQVIAEIPCWLLRSVLLQGYLYLTDSHLCFFAHMPSREDQVLKSSYMSKRAQRTKRWIKHWFILKNDVLSWYHSAADPYFPHGVVDLRYVISCDPVDDKGIRLRTNQKVIKLSTDSGLARDEWVKAIRRVIFKAQNMGDSVKVAIPYSSILDVEKSSALDFSETIEVKVVDKADNFATVDSYFFAYFQDLSGALDQIRDAVRSYRTTADHSDGHLIDTTSARPGLTNDRLGPDQTPRASSGGFRFPSLWRPFSDAGQSRAPPIPEAVADVTEEFTHITRRKTSFVPLTSSPETGSPRQLSSSELSDSTPQDSTILHVSTDSSHTYPPTTSSDHSAGHAPQWGRPSWLKIPSRRAFSAVSPSSSTDHQTTPSSGITDVLTSALSSAGSRLMPDLGFSVLDLPDSKIDPDVQEKFRTAFAFDDKEMLLGYFPGYLLRILPVYGRLYISTNYFCFKSSSGPLTPRTKMILPVRDVLSTDKSRAFHITSYGLVIMIRGYEELFFEFPADERRASFVHLLETQAELSRNRTSSGEVQPSQGQLDALFLEDAGPQHSYSMDSENLENNTDALPSHMFASTSSTFLTFKPPKPLHITCLTIGSRGDVQPYIALAKGLMAEGHKVRIATHGEFREWIESYGIEFGYVGGDPAELIRICVENGMFTVSFLKEGVAKFRGWIDDLLKTSWEACQGTDLLIESPSAMGGCHIAEAMEIPYFRAFTMTWSRTRAYPHAFAVPERKLGGNYNYVSYVLFDQVFWRGIAGQVNRWRRNTLGLHGTNLDKMEPNKMPFLYNFSPSVVPPPLDWPDWIRVTGYWFLDDADVSSTKWTPPSDLLDFIESGRAAGKKVVYIGFGSIVVSDPKAMTRCVIDAIVQSDVYAILSKGWSDRLNVGTSADAAEVEVPLPKQIYAISSIPHDWLFKRIDAACHHGGAGTTGASLRAGIPTIIRPFFGDQYFWADRVEAMGIGSAVRKLTVEHLSEALVSATTDEKQIQRAKSVGEKIRAENGVSTAIEAIYRDLEYARSLTIKRRNNAGLPHDEGHDTENATIRKLSSPFSSVPQTPERPSTRSSLGSATGAASEDWSVISDQEEQNLSPSKRNTAEPTSPPAKRRSLIAVLSALPESFSPSSSPPRV